MNLMRALAEDCRYRGEVHLLKHSDMKVCGGLDVELHALLTFVQDGR